MTFNGNSLVDVLGPDPLDSVKISAVRQFGECSKVQQIEEALVNAYDRYMLKADTLKIHPT